MVDLNREKKSKPVYVGKERGSPIPVINVGACAALISIFVLTMVCLIVIWAVTR